MYILQVFLMLFYLLLHSVRAHKMHAFRMLFFMMSDCMMMTVDEDCTLLNDATMYDAVIHCIMLHSE